MEGASADRASRGVGGIEDRRRTPVALGQVEVAEMRKISTRSLKAALGTHQGRRAAVLPVAVRRRSRSRWPLCAQRAEKAHQVGDLGVAQLDRRALGMLRRRGAGMAMRELRVAHRGMGRRDVVAHHLLQRRELAGVHVGRPAGDAAQAWGLERAHQLRVVADHEAQLVALLGAGVAERPEAVELVALQPWRTPSARPRSGGAGVARRHAGVVEGVVGEQRAVVAGGALPLADEEAQARAPPAASSTCCPARVAGASTAAT